MIDALPMLTPALPVILAGLVAGLIPHYGTRKIVTLIGPLLAAALWFAVDVPGTYGVIAAAGFQFETFRFDSLSRVWGLVFIIAAFLNSVYGLHARDRMQDASALVYAGAALGAVFAGDLLTLFFFWELTALSSVFLIWASGTPASFRAGLRYLVIHVLSGVLLLGGSVIYALSGGSWEFGAIGLDAPGGWLIFLAFGIKSAFPLMHNWVQDAYPKSTVVGAVVLSAFTTKLAIYALARSYAGTEMLIYIGAVMAAYPVFLAIVENDLRKVLAYSLVSQLGFMVVGVGIGSELALNGAAAHAFVGIIYTALLFMSLGAVLYRTGTVKASELGGLFKSMPYTAVFCIIGAATISAFPFLASFIAKSLTLAAAAQEGHWIVWLTLVFASVGVLGNTGIKTPFMAFFAKDSGKRVKEAPANMLLAMALAATLCITIGIWPQYLYAILPYAVSYQPYTFDHLVGQMQLLLGAIFAFALLMRLGLYSADRAGIHLDTDWLYRRLGDGAVRWSWAMLDRLMAAGGQHMALARKKLGRRFYAIFSPAGALSREIPSGVLSILTSILLGLVLLVAYLAG